MWLVGSLHASSESHLPAKKDCRAFLFLSINTLCAVNCLFIEPCWKIIDFVSHRKRNPECGPLYPVSHDRDGGIDSTHDS